MNFRIERNEKVAIIAPQVHKLDAVNTSELKSIFHDLVEKEGFKNFVLNLSSVKYIDSSGLSAILVGNKLSNEHQGSFVVCEVNEHVAKLLSISQLDRIINILPTQHEAVEAIFMDEIERELNNNHDEEQE
jgi:anti-anti-sigma factor